MNVSKWYVWLLAILIGSFFGYLIFKSCYTTPYSFKLQAGQNHGGAKTVDATESVATSTKDIVTTEIAGDERFQIGHYVSRLNSTMIGKEFNFDDSTLVVARRVLRDQTFKRKPIESVDAKTLFSDLLTPVTGCSSNHYGELRPHIEDFRKSLPGTKCFFYDLGLSDEQINEVKNMPDLMYRKFDFNAYPEHVRNLQSYAWKPLIIQEMLSEFDGTMWFDSSVRFLGNLAKKCNRTYVPPQYRRSVLSRLNRPLRNSRYSTGHAWILPDDERGRSLGHASGHCSDLPKQG